MKVAKDLVVSLDFTMTHEEQGVIDSSEKDGPLVYLHGHNSFLPALESALEGRAVGDSLTVELSPAEAYGEINPELRDVVDVSHFSEMEVPVEVGMHFEAESEYGPVLLTVTKIEGNEVTVDGNHPLAGMALTFDVTVKEIRPAREAELTHGHPHEDGNDEHS